MYDYYSHIVQSVVIQWSVMIIVAMFGKLLYENCLSNSGLMNICFLLMEQIL